MFRRCLLACAALLLSACAVNPITESWSDPKGSKPIQFSKTLVLANLATPADRRIAEEQWVASLPVIKGSASYDLLDDGALKDLPTAKAKVRDAGYSHALVMRLVGSKQEIVSVPSATFARGGFWGGMHSGWAVSTNDVETREVVAFELSLYSLSDDKLVWSGNGEITNPRKIADSVKKLADGTSKQWAAEGLVIGGAK